MEFIRQVGSQAEVNDGGIIRRLPFSGEGVPPQPGTRVNPVLNECCCPSAVPLEPDRGRGGSRVPDPRRVSNNSKNSSKPLIFIPTVWMSQSLSELYKISPEVYHAFGERNNLTALLGQDIKLCIHPSLTNLLLPIPQNFLEWDLKDNTFKYRSLKPSDKEIFLWQDEWSGLDAHLLGDWINSKVERELEWEEQSYEDYKTSLEFFIARPDNGFTGYLKRQFTSHNKLNLFKVPPTDEQWESLMIASPRTDIKIWLFQPFQDKRTIENFAEIKLGYGILRAYQREIDDPSSNLKRWLKEKKYPVNRIFLSKNAVKPLLNWRELLTDDPGLRVTNHLFYHLLPPESKVTPKVFMKWYNNPRSLKYERIH